MNSSLFISHRLFAAAAANRNSTHESAPVDSRTSREWLFTGDRNAERTSLEKFVNQSLVSANDLVIDV